MSPEEKHRLDVIFCEIARGLGYAQSWMRTADWLLRRYGTDPAGRLGR